MFPATIYRAPSLSPPAAGGPSQRLRNTLLRPDVRLTRVLLLTVLTRCHRHVSSCGRGPSRWPGRRLFLGKRGFNCAEFSVRGR
eukprot:3025987-Alexandrium_andersonii.AAC.1